ISGDLGKVYDSFAANRLAGHENEITSVIIGSGIESLGDYAFLECPLLQGVTMTKSVESIGRMCFSEASALETVTSMEGVKDIDYAAFYGCEKLKNIVLPAVETIGNQAFYHCTSLENAVIGGTVSALSNYSFAGCSSMKTLTLPETLTEICEAAVNGCSALEDVYFAGTQEQWNSAAGDAEAKANYPIHPEYYPIITLHVAPVANGTLGGRVGWWFDDSDKITFTGADFLGTGEAVMTATYSADGRMTGLQLLNPTTLTQTVADGYGSVKMMLLGSGLAPATEAAGFEAP
ncbi:MAG: leucine-rich repeat domain-containing protein, partial [Firmicutes bacterium]|nr:leucine-rich repeat domain-containing protein [Bacillota bacterium]